MTLAQINDASSTRELGPNRRVWKTIGPNFLEQLQVTAFAIWK